MFKHYHISTRMNSVIKEVDGAVQDPERLIFVAEPMPRSRMMGFAVHALSLVRLGRMAAALVKMPQRNPVFGSDAAQEVNIRRPRRLGGIGVCSQKFATRRHGKAPQMKSTG